MLQSIFISTGCIMHNQPLLNLFSLFHDNTSYLPCMDDQISRVRSIRTTMQHSTPVSGYMLLVGLAVRVFPILQCSNELLTNNCVSSCIATLLQFNILNVVIAQKFEFNNINSTSVKCTTEK